MYIHQLTYLLLLFSSACTDRCRGGGGKEGGGGGGTQLSVSSKAGGLEKGHPLSSEGVSHGVAPSFSWSSSRSPAGVLGVVCPEGRLVYRHTCEHTPTHVQIYRDILTKLYEYKLSHTLSIHMCIGIRQYICIPVLSYMWQYDHIPVMSYVWRK